MTPGTRLGPYEILAPLGAGGMGEVYRARDARLGRDVAVKVLPQHLSDQPEIRARFEREAKTISSLNHPNICTLFDVGREGVTDYLVMELIEGDTLAQRLAKGAMPIADVLKIGSQIADALDRAHRAGVVHRDLKPGNVMLTRTGAKLMDFGLARATGLAGPGSGSSLTRTALTQSPTVAGPLTAEGAIVGTFQYMSPEQLEGKEADARSDIWALGCVLYEMASGHRAFEGASQASLIGAIMNAAPRPLAEVAPMSPPELDRLVRQCLTRDPDDRWQSARDLGRELAMLGSASTASGSAVRGPATHAGARTGAMLPWALSSVMLVLLLATGWWALRSQGAGAGAHVVSTLLPPQGYAYSAAAGPMVFSPDGRQIAFIAEDSVGATSLWVRALDSALPRQLAGTEGAQMPFWSPDGRDLGYFSSTELKRIPVAGGAPQVLAPAGLAAGGSWTRDGQIYFVPGLGKGIERVPAAGGDVATVVDTSRTEMARTPAWPCLLPDGKHMLFVSYISQTLNGARDGLYVISLDGKSAPQLLLPDAMMAQYVAPGSLYFWRNSALWVQAFDAGSQKLSGVPSKVQDGVLFESLAGAAFFAVSLSGDVVTLQGSADAGQAEVVLVDRAGHDIERVAPPANYYSPRLSHDGRRFAIDRSDPVSGEGDIWVFDIARKVGDRITSNPLNETCPVWAPDDSRLYWMSTIGAPGTADIHARDLAGGAEQLILHRSGRSMPLDVSPDGRTIVFQERLLRSAERGTLLTYSLADKSVAPWTSTARDESFGRISPDGQWFAVISRESGQDEVYVERFPQGGERWRVSTSGGIGASWRRDGHELYYYSASHEIMSVAFQGKSPPEIGIPTPLFRTPLRTYLTLANFDVMPDGQRFLMVRPVRADAGAAYTLEQGWHAEENKR
jgi:Tol biopolymer transport system component